ncbi:MAG: Flp pilus assembly protein CpaB [Bryobacteraceae bacterium]
MKKNMVPLLAIAFIVAIISTGLFYGLFASKLSGSSTDLPKQSVVIAAKKLPRGAVLVASDVQVTEVRGRTAFGSSFSRPEEVIGSTVIDAVGERQVLTKSALVSPNSTESGNVPTGMRGVTIHVFESGGVLALLRPGSKVDIQAISDRNTSSADPHTVLRTILQNIEVLSTNLQPEPVALHFSAPTVTVLVRPEDCDLVAVADAGARLRLVLRNRVDEGSGPRFPLATSAVFLSGRDRARTVPAQPAVAWERIVSVTDKGAQELAASLRTPLDPKVPHVTGFNPKIDADSLVSRMEANKDLVMLSSRNLAAELPMPLGRGFLISGYSDNDRRLMVIVTPRARYRPTGLRIDR